MPTKSKRNPAGVPASEVVEGVLSDLGHEHLSYGHWRHSLFRNFILARSCGPWSCTDGSEKRFRKW
jgi:hypothetical protein